MKQGDITIQGQAAVLPKAKVGYFTYDMATTGSLAITGVGFSPAYMLFCSGDNNSGFAVWFVSATGVGVNNSGGVSNFHAETANAVYNQTYHNICSGASTEARFVVGSFDTDGFTLTRTKVGSPSGTLSCSYMAFK